MNIYVINLAKNTERMASMDAQLKALGLEYERIEAVYGKALSKAERKAQFAAFRSYCASGYRLYDGEIGCALSHIAIYRKMVAENVSMALVLEDDVVLDGGLKNRVEEIAKFADVAKPQVFLLSAHGVKDVDKKGVERIRGGTCTDGYVITMLAAKIVVNANFPVVTVADRWSRWEKRYCLEMYRVWPIAVKQDNGRFGTDIDPCLFNRSKQIAHMIWARVKRPIRAIGIGLDWLYFWRYGR